MWYDFQDMAYTSWNDTQWQRAFIQTFHIMICTKIQWKPGNYTGRAEYSFRVWSPWYSPCPEIVFIRNSFITIRVSHLHKHEGKVITNLFKTLPFQCMKTKYRLIALKPRMTKDTDTSRPAQGSIILPLNRLWSMQPCPVKEHSLMNRPLPFCLHLNKELTPIPRGQFHIQNTLLLEWIIP